VAAARRDDVVVHYRDLAADEIGDRWVTSPVRTVVDCCLDLPFDEAPFESVLRAIVTSVPGLVARGWLVLRFTWMQVMFEPGLVAETVRAVVDLRRTGRRSGGTRVVRTTKSA